VARWHVVRGGDEVGEGVTNKGLIPVMG
jgi:hypothetical protein